MAPFHRQQIGLLRLQLGGREMRHCLGLHRAGDNNRTLQHAFLGGLYNLSLGVEITFGKLKLLDLGDLTWDKELQLVCPANPLGHMDIYIVSHHGWKQSSSPALVDAIHARVAIMDNGETKGGSIGPLDTIQHAPDLETLWQLHYSAEGAEAHNTSAPYIANLLGTDAANHLELTASKDGSFDVTNSRTKATRHYPASH